MSERKTKYHFLYSVLSTFALGAISALILFANGERSIMAINAITLYVLLIAAILASVFTIMRFVFHIDNQRHGPEDDVKLSEFAEDQDVHSIKHS